MIRRFECVCGTGRYKVHGAATLTADGAVIELLGGEKPHVGAVAFAVPRPSLANPDRTSASVAVVPRYGHRDDEVARPAADRAARALGMPVVVIVGLHIRAAGPQDIRKLVQQAETALETTISMLIDPSRDISPL